MDSERAPRRNPRRLVWPKLLTRPHHKCLLFHCMCDVCMAVATTATKQQQQQHSKLNTELLHGSGWVHLNRYFKARYTRNYW